MIRSFRDKRAVRIIQGKFVKGLGPDVADVARRKLLLLERAMQLEQLRSPPDNRLEALRGDRRGQHSIRVNDQFRICFVWREDGAHEVEIVDYH